MADYYINPSKATWAQNVDRLKALFEKWGVDMADWQLDSDIAPGVGRNAEQWGPCAARLRYRHPKSKNVVQMELGTQKSAARNLNSIIITLEDIYMQERRGLGGIAAAHYLALAAPAMKRDPYEVLGIRPDASPDDIEDMYRIRAKRAHPDTGGSTEAMKELNEAYEDAKRRLA